MGKRQNKNKPDKPTATLKPRNTDEDEDAESVYSSVHGDYQNSDSDEMDVEIADSAERAAELFAELVDNALDKNVNTRCKALDSLNTLLRRSCVAEVLDKHKATLCDIVEKNIRRTHEESVRALKLGALLAIQCGLDIERELDPAIGTMLAIFIDPVATDELRITVADFIGITTYFGVYHPQRRGEVLNTLRQFWSNMKPNTNQPQLFTATLFSWVLVLERCESDQIEQALDEVYPRLCAFLTSNATDIRVAVGEALAVLFELAVQNVNEEYKFPNHAELRAIMEEMGGEFTKSRAKKDRKLQKWTFRQCIDAIFNGKLPESSVKFNKKEHLDLDGCHTKLLYDYLCLILKGDLNTHLAKNEVLRELFDLGEVDTKVDALPSKADKAERKNQLSSADKQRNIRRAKLRDRKAI